jgi:hypothetical protein
MAFTEESANTPSGGGVRWFLPSGTSIASATTISFADANSAVVLTGSTPIVTINDFEDGEVFVVRPATGSVITLTTGGNIARTVAFAAHEVYLLWNDGGTIYPMGINSGTGIVFTPYGHLASTTVQDAIEELVDEKTNTPNLTEDTSPVSSADYLTTWDTSASAYKKVLPDNLMKARTITTGSGLTGGGTLAADRTLALSISGLTQDTTPDITADYIPTYDASFGGNKKVLLSAVQPPFSDTNAMVKGSSDSTKQLRFEVDGFTAGATRILTPPDNNATLAGINIAQTFSAAQTFTGNVVVGSTGTALKGVWYAAATLDFPSISAQYFADMTVTVTGAAVGDVCSVSQTATFSGAVALNAFVSSANTVTVRAFNVTAGAINPASDTFYVTVFDFT